MQRVRSPSQSTHTVWCEKEANRISVARSLVSYDPSRRSRAGGLQSEKVVALKQLDVDGPEQQSPARYTGGQASRGSFGIRLSKALSSRSPLRQQQRLQ